MQNSYYVVCVSDLSIPDQFKIELQKVLDDFQLSASPFEVKKSLYGTSLTTAISFEIELPGPFRDALMKLSNFHRIDIGIIEKQMFETKKRLVVFDMDSTLITAEVIDEMALRHGVGEKVSQITARAMNGELNFDQSLQERVSLLKGLQRQHMEAIVKDLRFTPGTENFLAHLRSLGIKTAIASGGFEYFARFVQRELKMDYVFAKNLEFHSDQLTGLIQGPIVNAQRKEDIVMELGTSLGLSLDEIVAIGDGANDIPMLLKAGLGIAIHAKEKVQQSAHYRINFGPMTHALSFMNHEAL
jgi:phosphoserine phosphatase